MKDLKKEIELKKINIESYHNEKYADGFIDGVNEALEVIDQYNIITAPKTIKLSEIIERLQPTIDEKLYYKKVDFGNTAIGYDFVDGFGDECTTYFRPVVYFDENMEIIGFTFTPSDTFNWIYEMWITKTIITNDWKEE